MTEAFAWDEEPRHVPRDRNGAFGGAYTRHIRAMGFRDHPIAARSPWQNGHIERLIGSIRPECLNQVVVVGEAHPRRMLRPTPCTPIKSGPICCWAKARRTLVAH